jgi:hypothetical protein
MPKPTPHPICPVTTLDCWICRKALLGNAVRTGFILLGEVKNGWTLLSDAGEMTKTEWLSRSDRLPDMDQWMGFVGHSKSFSASKAYWGWAKCSAGSIRFATFSLKLNHTKPIRTPVYK